MMVNHCAMLARHRSSASAPRKSASSRARTPSSWSARAATTSGQGGGGEGGGARGGGGGGAASPALVKAVETALGAVAKVLQDTEKKRRARSQSGAPEVETLPAKLFSFKAGGNNDRLIKAPHLPDRTLGNYLALPLDAYSLLDPKWISRSPEDPSLFQLAIPLQELVGLALQPRLSIRVDIDPANGQVNFHASRFSLGVPKFDADFKLDMKAKLQHRPVPEAFALPALDFWRSSPSTRRKGEPAGAAPAGSSAAAGRGRLGTAPLPWDAILSMDAEDTTQQHAPMHGDPVTPLKATTSIDPSGVGAAAAPSASTDQEGSGSSAAGASAQQEEASSSSSSNHAVSSALLWCSVDVEIEALAPYPLAVVPRPLLNLTASLVTKFTIQQLLPAFLQLLSVDYERWALGKVQARTEAAGSLLALTGPRGGSRSLSLGQNGTVSSSIVQDGSASPAVGGAPDAGSPHVDVVSVCVEEAGGSIQHAGSSGSMQEKAAASI